MGRWAAYSEAQATYGEEGWAQSTPSHSHIACDENVRNQGSTHAHDHVLNYDRIPGRWLLRYVRLYMPSPYLLEYAVCYAEEARR